MKPDIQQRGLGACHQSFPLSLLWFPSLLVEEAAHSALVIALSCAALLAIASRAHSQGCMGVADHTLGWTEQGGSYLESHEWLVLADYRWVHADRIFVGTHDVTSPANPGVVDDIHYIDLLASYAVTKRFRLSLNVPFQYGERTSKVENEFVVSRTASAGGLGDIRLLGDFWLLPPAKFPDGNISIGLGFKAPTGQDDTSDLYYRSGNLVRRPNHVSLQPGDGGWGLILEMQAFQKVFERSFVYVSGSYLINPRDQNGVAQTLADTSIPPVAAAIGTINSVPDSYIGRIGASYELWPKLGLSVSLGGRVEGIPVHDLIGGSDGYRAPGYAVSIEPGLAITRGKATLTVSAPVAVERNREPSVPNMRAGIQGPAAFADYLILASLSWRF